MSETVYIEGSGVIADVKIDTWLRDILPRTPGCVRKVAKQEFLRACREFYTDSGSWRDTTRPKSITAQRTRFYLSPHNNIANVVRVLGASIDGVPLRPLRSKPTRVTTAQATPSCYWMESPDVLCLHPTPLIDLEGELQIYVALAPKPTVRCLPGMAFTHHYDALMDGVLGRLLAHPAKAYSNPTLAQYHLKRFRAAIGRYAGEAKTGYAGAQSWVFPAFGK